jgi:DNA-binding HxlR family transcriptional regulator
MSDQGGYGQFCPVAKASEIITTRWTPLVLRELLCGSHRFNEIRRGVPLMSPTLLSKRLKELEEAGVIAGVAVAGGKAKEYHLTECGEELRPIILALGLWGRRWVESAIESRDWDAGALMWDMRRMLDPAAMPAGRNVIQFEFRDAAKEMRLWWLVVEGGEVDLCQSDPGHEVDLYIYSDVRSMARVWIGKDSLRAALDDGRIDATGDRALRRDMLSWMKLAVVAQAAGQGG